MFHLKPVKRYIVLTTGIKFYENILLLKTNTQKGLLSNYQDILQKTRDLLSMKDESDHYSTGRGTEIPVLGYAPFTSLTQEIIRQALINLDLPPTHGKQGRTYL